MRRKSLDEWFPPWHIFGFYGTPDRVCITNGQTDVVEGIAKPAAQRLVDERHRLLEVMWELCQVVEQHGENPYTIVSRERK